MDLWAIIKYLKSQMPRAHTWCEECYDPGVHRSIGTVGEAAHPACTGGGAEGSLERLTAQKTVGVSQEKWEWAILAIRNIHTKKK